MLYLLLLLLLLSLDSSWLKLFPVKPLETLTVAVCHCFLAANKEEVFQVAIPRFHMVCPPFREPVVRSVKSAVKIPQTLPLQILLLHSKSTEIQHLRLDKNLKLILG